MAAMLDPRTKFIHIYERTYVEIFSQEVHRFDFSPYADHIASLRPRASKKRKLEVPSSDNKSISRRSNDNYNSGKSQCGFQIFMRASAHQDAGRNVDDQINDWLQAPSIEFAQNPLLYWSNNESVYPELSVLAKIYLSASASSAESERVFSSGDEVAAKRRNKLGVSRLAQLIFIKHDAKLQKRAQELCF